jgi:dTMP kinase
VLCNRYTTSNRGHQAAKAEDPEEILQFIEEIEYTIVGLPKPDLVILLSLPPEQAQKLVDKKKERDYTTAKRDLHEKDINHLRKAYKTYHYVAQRGGWVVVDCVKEGELRTIEDIHEEIWAHVQQRI